MLTIILSITQAIIDTILHHYGTNCYHSPYHCPYQYPPLRQMFTILHHFPPLSTSIHHSPPLSTILRHYPPFSAIIRHSPPLSQLGTPPRDTQYPIKLTHSDQPRIFGCKSKRPLVKTAPTSILNWSKRPPSLNKTAPLKSTHFIICKNPDLCKYL